MFSALPSTCQSGPSPHSYENTRMEPQLPIHNLSGQSNRHWENQHHLFWSVVSQSGLCLHGDDCGSEHPWGTSCCLCCGPWLRLLRCNRWCQASRFCTRSLHSIGQEDPLLPVSQKRILVADSGWHWAKNHWQLQCPARRASRSSGQYRGVHLPKLIARKSYDAPMAATLSEGFPVLQNKRFWASRAANCWVDLERSKPRRAIFLFPTQKNNPWIVWTSILSQLVTPKLNINCNIFSPF